MLKFPAINDRLHELLAEDPENRVPRVWEVMFPVPSQNGLRGEKRFLQHLQLGCSSRRWVLKSPDHVYGLEELLAVFPDAVIIQTHRNPFEVLPAQRVEVMRTSDLTFLYRMIRVERSGRLV
jgi:Sulfotransferase family